MSSSTLKLRSQFFEALRPGWPGAFILLGMVALVVFTVIPGTIEGKSLAVLHGLCAQQPTHSYYFGEARLPFDARMTGIYGGFAATVVYLALGGRWRATGIRDVKIVAALVLFMLPLAVDGTNSLLNDIEMFHLYEPRNAVRTVTGILLGISMGTFVWLLIGQTAFRPSIRSHQQVWRGLPELGAVTGIQLVLLAVLGLSNLPIRIPLTYVLMVSAATMVSGLILPFVLLLTRSEQAAESTADLARPATIALLGALLFIAATSGGRFLLEAALGLPSEVPG